MKKNLKGREVAKFNLCWRPSITTPQKWGILQYKGCR